MGINEFIADSPQSYVQMAIELASHRDLAHSAREKIAAGSDVLFENMRAVDAFAEFLLSTRRTLKCR